MAALKKRYYQKIDEEVYSAILDSGMSLSIIKKKVFVEKAALLSTNFGALDNHFYIDGELQSYPAGIAHFLEHKGSFGAAGAGAGCCFAVSPFRVRSKS